MARVLVTSLLIPALCMAGAAQQPAAPAPQTPPIRQPGATPDAPQATFRSSTRLVVQNVTVKDREGNTIQGLTARDFSVLEENRPQEIAFVEYQRIQGEPGSAPPEPVTVDAGAPALPLVPPATATSISVAPPGAIKYQDRRLLAIYFDQSSMGQADQFRAFSSALKYIDTQMAAADMIAIITFQNGAVRVRQDFTDSKALLREVILTLQAGDDLDGDGIADSPEATAFGQADGEFNVFNTDRQLSALQTAVTMLRALPERKTLIYFGSGLRLNGSDNMAQLSATTNAAVRANVTINPVDARGLEASAPMGNAAARGPAGQALFSGAGGTALASRNERSQDTLFALAKDTGGRAMFDYNDLSVGITQAAQAITDYYIVGYYSTHTAPDGRFRRIRVTLNGNEQAQLTYRQGYFADKTFANFTDADKERQLEEALMLEDPITEITIAMELNYFQLNRAEYYVPVAMKIPGSELTLARRRGAARTTMDFIGEIKDEYGITITNIRDKIDIRLSDEDAEQLARRPIQYESGYTLLPGKYVIKVLARDATTGRIGTYQTAFTVPNLVREAARIPISSVVLSSQRVPLGDALFSVSQRESDAVNPLIHDGQKLIPSVTRVFSRNRDLYVYLQAYQRGATTIKPLVAFVTFYRGEEKAFETAPLPVLDGLDPRSKAVPMRFSVPLGEFPPGRYECQVTVLEPGAQKAAFWRAPVVIVP